MLSKLTALMHYIYLYLYVCYLSIYFQIIYRFTVLLIQVHSVKFLLLSLIIMQNLMTQALILYEEIMFIAILARDRTYLFFCAQMLPTMILGAHKICSANHIMDVEVLPMMHAVLPSPVWLLLVISKKNLFCLPFPIFSSLVI